jgi:hypothetical protein
MVSNCTSCTAGHYCGSRGLTAPTGQCEQGYFCGGGSSVATPYDTGRTEFQVSYVGGTCEQTLNTTLFELCVTGQYVGDTCVVESSIQKNDICPPGHYCPTGSVSPIQCPPGTNSSSVGLTNETDCAACQRGFYCPLNATVFATRQCLPGYYCPTGTGVVNDSILCPTGSHCPLGSPEPTQCLSGTYQDEIGQSTCKVSCGNDCCVFFCLFVCLFVCFVLFCLFCFVNANLTISRC